MNIAYCNEIKREDCELYALALCESGKTYNVTFYIDGGMQYQLALLKEGAKVVKILTKNCHSIQGTYSYNIIAKNSGILYLKDLKNILPGVKEWTKIENIEVKEV